MTKVKSTLEDTMTEPYTVSDCIVFPLRDFAIHDLEDTNDRINLWQSADTLAESILSKLKENGYAISKN